MRLCVFCGKMRRPDELRGRGVCRRCWKRLPPEAIHEWRAHHGRLEVLAFHFIRHMERRHG